MRHDERFTGRRDHLKRLAPEFYRGEAYVHWSMAIQDRKTGWLSPAFHVRLREILTHTMFRYGQCCPLYCCMPDHLHLLWIGIFAGSDQLRAAQYFRKHVNSLLAGAGVRLQREAYDHVLRENERRHKAFASMTEYIARNPERKDLVPLDRYADYPYTGCVVPGYPELCVWSDDFWPRFWRAHDYLRKNGLMRV